MTVCACCASEDCVHAQDAGSRWRVCVCVGGGLRWGWCAADSLWSRNTQANVQAAANDGGTALILSAQQGHDGCVRQLLEAKVRACAMRMPAH